MNLTFLEIVELPNGDIVVRQADSKEDPFIFLRFSEQSRFYLGSARMEVARRMIQSGLKAINAMAKDGAADAPPSEQNDAPGQEEYSPEHGEDEGYELDGDDLAASPQGTVH